MAALTRLSWPVGFDALMVATAVLNSDKVVAGMASAARRKFRCAKSLGASAARLSS